MTIAFGGTSPAAAPVGAGVLSAATGAAVPTVGAALPAAAGAAQVTALPRAGVGGLEDNASVNFLLVGSVLMLLYMALGFLIRRGRGEPALEDDGITGL